jgi:2-polyprenyl-3-methyl-5-hydroxy-6-metoxy-1,4-benzoquinol methylase
MGQASSSRLATSDEVLKAGRDTYSSAIADAQNYMRWLVDNFRPYLGGHILEVGIGHGHYSTLLAECGDYLGIDHDEQSVAEARVAFPGRAFAVCDILDGAKLRAFLPRGPDAIVSINVLEHIEDDRTAIANLVDVLKPGGHLLLSVPAMMMLYNDLDRLAGHCRRYSSEGLKALLSTEPVDILRLCYFNPIGGLGWWANSLKRHQSLNDESVNGQIRFFDRYIVPVSRVLDPLFRPFFGQSVTCIARRR